LKREAYTEADVDTTYQDPSNPLQHTMSGHQRSVSQAGGPEKTYFEQQREVLIGEIAMVNKAPLQLASMSRLLTRLSRASSTFSPTLTS
jgi:hypothetical protein